MPAKKTTAKKISARKTAAKKSTAKRATARKKSTVKRSPVKKSTAKKTAAKRSTVKKTARKPAARTAGSNGAGIAKPGDRIVIDSPQVGSLPREGEILRVIQGEVSVSYRVKWADGHETLISPRSGSARIVPASRRS